VQFEHAKERLQRSVHDFREHQEQRLQEAHAALQAALHELISLQRRRPKAQEAGEEEMPHETRLGLTYRALEEALQEWKRTLRQTKRLAGAAA
jgi:hypothetical protein